MDSEVISIGTQIGFGAHAVIYKAKIKETNETIAVKKIAFEDKEGKERALAEFNLMKNLNNNNIVKLIDLSVRNGMVLIALEYCEGKSLAHALVKSKFVKPMAQDFTIQTLSGLVYLHNNNIVHRDLKPENLLLSKGVVKICDFGEAVYLPQNSELQETRMVGTKNYMAPEMIQMDKYNHTCDVWSLGATVLHFLTGQPPFADGGEPIYLIVHKQIPIPGYLDLDSRSFLECCFVKNQRQRPSSLDLSKHRFVSNALREINTNLSPAGIFKEFKKQESIKTVLESEQSFLDEFSIDELPVVEGNMSIISEEDEEEMLRNEVNSLYEMLVSSKTPPAVVFSHLNGLVRHYPEVKVFISETQILSISFEVLQTTNLKTKECFLEFVETCFDLDSGLQFESCFYLFGGLNFLLQQAMGQRQLVLKLLNKSCDSETSLMLFQSVPFLSTFMVKVEEGTLEAIETITKIAKSFNYNIIRLNDIIVKAINLFNTELNEELQLSIQKFFQNFQSAPKQIVLKELLPKTFELLVEKINNHKILLDLFVSLSTHKEVMNKIHTLRLVPKLIGKVNHKEIVHVLTNYIQSNEGKRECREAGLLESLKQHNDELAVMFEYARSQYEDDLRYLIANNAIAKFAHCLQTNKFQIKALDAISTLLNALPETVEKFVPFVDKLTTALETSNQFKQTLNQVKLLLETHKELCENINANQLINVLYEQRANRNAVYLIIIVLKGNQKAELSLEQDKFVKEWRLKAETDHKWAMELDKY